MFVNLFNQLTSAKAKLEQLFNNPTTKSQLMVELAVTVDAGEPFVKATYYLEGDGPLVFTCYEKIMELKAAVRTAFYPNTIAVINQLASGSGNALHQQLTKYSKHCVKPGHDYFIAKFDGELKPAVQLFKAARYFDPCKVSELKPNCCDIDDLKSFPCLNDDSIIDELKAELPLSGAHE